MPPVWFDISDKAVGLLLHPTQNGKEDVHFFLYFSFPKSLKKVYITTQPVFHNNLKGGVMYV
jgi:hypothetical protein